MVKVTGVKGQQMVNSTVHNTIKDAVASYSTLGWPTTITVERNGENAQYRITGPDKYRKL